MVGAMQSGKTDIEHQQEGMILQHFFELDNFTLMVGQGEIGRAVTYLQFFQGVLHI